MSLPSIINLAVCLLFTAAFFVFYAVFKSDEQVKWQLKMIFGVIGCAAVQIFIQWREGGYTNDPDDAPRAKGFPVIPPKDKR